ncbi:sigma-70 family RNA polymerase sigma factor [Planosporangium thailandense]|uniref:Sigma-70 family RNA polymerase sigma factor n=1 Tax=Planosporangium thailandense TaxID=765197 RepID=A0ABX0XTU0_9ACTN|nr:ECF subfamily RNA polymerase sigma factor, BldN family [Planosporangium thailandense]NJC69322.1 sigma-70 family RNA polymerase sigma factor [Planosporangium thailandense]
MSGYELSSGPDVLAGHIEVNDSLDVIRKMMATTLRADGGVPHTRERPYSGPPATRHSPGTNTRPADNRSAPAGRVSPEGRSVSPEARGEAAAPATHSFRLPAESDQQAHSVALDAESDERTGGSDGPPPGYPDRPEATEAATAVWLLVERAQAGDAEAFGLIYDRYFDTVFRFVYFRVGNRQLAEDLTADTFLRALKRIGSFTWQGRDLGAWLVTIARNLVADHFKSGRYRLEVTTGDVLDAERAESGPEGSPESAVVDHITNVALLRAVKQLNPEQQECIVLRFLQGFSVAETAQAMGKNEGAIKALQYRAVRTLARLLPDGFQP